MTLGTTLGMGADPRVSALCAMAPRSYWSQWNTSCEAWAQSLIAWREEQVAGKACAQALRECDGGASPVQIGCDQVCPEDVGGPITVATAATTATPMACLTQVGPVCVTVPLLMVAAAAAYFVWGRS